MKFSEINPDDFYGIIAYKRVSTGKQMKTGYGMMDQEEVIEMWAEKLGLPILEWFEEQETATDKRCRYIQENAIAACKLRNALFVTARLDRIARNLNFWVRLNESNTKYFICGSPEASQMQLNMEMVFAQDYVTKAKENTTRAVAQRKKLGLPVGNLENMTQEGRLKGAQSMKDIANENPENIRAATLAMSMKDTHSKQKIADCLNANGYVTSTGKKFHRTSVVRLIKRFEDKIAI